MITESKAAITGSGLSIGMLKEPGLQLEGDEGMVEAVMVDAGRYTGRYTEWCSEAPCSMRAFEGLLGGRNLMTYAYTDVMDPWQENFETAYGRLVVSDDQTW